MTTGKERLVSVANQVPPALALVLLWMLLWGEFTWLNFVSGLGFAILVSVVFYLPPVQLSNRVNPWFVLVFLVRLIVDIVRASIDVAGLALSPRLVTSNAILAVHLRTRSDLILTWTAVATSIVPGSIVVDIDREHSTLYLHVLNMHSAGGIERFRREVLDTERRIIRAVGSREDVERLRGVVPADAPAASTRPDTTPQEERA
ncbi:Na+/H+ antiporter subunit E [Cryobacterium roopkundense]|uniref:Multicomponent Na+:H+ antiporter subunit E n=1 Tax=Cryobacterium roopkundense TaxID=1001240 RepID=A0A7W8ZT25_9MICO|nr:Na+/H+ antiporter subunit E [Cryobacterium roopkundense]MBB5639663.1 multicomponent Na+:H+ antiporter subunit E [Cryobacterium roopkundense]